MEAEPMTVRMGDEAHPEWLWWTGFIASSALLCVPLLLVDVPPLLDYPNHIARMEIMANIGLSPDLQRMFAVHWAIIPDLAIDAFMPWVVSMLPAHIAGRILLALILLLDVVGAGPPWWAIISLSCWDS